MNCEYFNNLNDDSGNGYYGGYWQILTKNVGGAKVI